jgi:hypothetical protein
LVDVPGRKVPSIANGEMANYLKNMVAPQVYIFSFLTVKVRSLIPVDVIA